MTPEAAKLAETGVEKALLWGRVNRWRFHDDDGLAESLALEALTEAAIRWVEDGRTGDFLPWAYIVVYRRFVDEARTRYSLRSKRPKPRDWSLEDVALVGQGEEETRTLADTMGEEDPGLGAVEMIELLTGANLSEKERELIVLLYEGYLLREIGEMEGISEAGVCFRRGKVRRKLARNLSAA